MTAVLDWAPVDLRGSTVPRIFTPPRWSGPPGPCGCGCALTAATSRGFEVVAFARDVLAVALLPWQRWWLIHAFELSIERHPVTGRRRLRFRTLLTLVARQQGKSWLLRIVALWALYVRRVRMVLGAAQSLDIARETWLLAVDLARSAPECAAEIPAVGGVRYTNGEQCFTLSDGQRYRITAATRGAGRGLSVDVLLLDELREHRDYLAWAALSKTTLARPDALICAVSNAGDDQSVVLNDLRTRAIEAISRCRAEPIVAAQCSDMPADIPAGAVVGSDGASLADPSGGLFLAEWSAPEGCALDDPAGWVAAMPGLNIDVEGPNGWQPAPITTEAVLGFLATDPPAVFRCLDIATPILTSSGWANMGALSMGDRVKGTSGEWASVVSVSPVYHDKPCYRVTLSDRRSLICDAEHLWTVKDRRRRCGWETVRTVDLVTRGVTCYSRCQDYHVRQFSLPPVEPLDGPDVDLPVHPYLLGLWLGDGSARAALVFAEARDAPHVRSMIESCGAVITKEIIDSPNCVRFGFRTNERYGDFTGSLHGLGIYANKYIPDVYFTGSFTQRLQLLQGLMDSDGTISKRTGRCIFTNTNDKLVTGVRSLVRSLGWKTSELGSGRYGKAHWRPRFDVCWTPRPSQAVPATLPRKLANIRVAKNYRDVRPVTIASIEPVPSTPVRCIEVDTPDSLFLADEFIPTHNTELLCTRVGVLDTAFDPVEWKACADPAFSLRAARESVAVCVDVALDGEHVTACGAARLPGERVGVAVLGAWSGRSAVAMAERALPGILTAIRPVEIGWFPTSPVGALGPVLRRLRRTTRKIIPTIKEGRIVLDDEHRAAQITATMEREAAQGLAELIRSRRLVHPSDPLLDAQTVAAQRVDAPGGESGWRLTRRGGGHCDATYAAAGACHLARMAPEPIRTTMRAQIY